MLHRIYAFTSLQIHGENGPLVLKGGKSSSLLAYLVLHPRIQHRREMLADMLWHDAAPERARRNLSDVLYRLQKDVEADWLIADADTLKLQPNENLWVDVWEFDRLIVSKDQGSLQKAVELYTGDLLQEIYADWILPERELRRSQFVSALETLSNQYEAQGKLQEALLYTRRLILTESLHEPAHQTYIRLLGRLRRFGEAFVHYDQLCILLRDELDSKPTAEIDAMIQALARERDLEDGSVVVEEAHPFVGRKAERAAALSVVEDMLNGSGSLLTVEGEAGIGKSRFLREIISGARWRGAHVLQSQASETPGASPFLPLMEALTPLFNSPRGKELDALLTDEIRAVLAPLNPAWSVGGISSDEQTVMHFKNALQVFGEALARLKSVVLVLDEMHWASPVLWESLRSFAAGFARQGGLLILAYRHQVMESQRGWEILQAWEKDGLLKTILLKPFTEDEVAQLVGDTKNIDPAEISAWSGGNPFFINQRLNEPTLKRSTNHDVISLRLQILTPHAKSALECASVLGENIPYRLWAEISELPPLALAGLADELVTGRWLQPTSDGYSFTHDLIRSAVYAQIEPIRRRGLHERAAQIYLTRDPDNLQARAYHLDHAGLEVDSAKMYKLAGEQDLSRFAFREAQTAFERALALTPTTEAFERVEIALALARACGTTGDRNRQESALDEAVAGARENDPQLLRALLLAGRFASQTGRPVAAKRQLEAALGLAKKLKDRTRETEAILTLAELNREQSHWSDAKKQYNKALRLARANSNASDEGKALRGIGYVISDQGDPHESIKWIEKAIDVYRALGNPWLTAHTQTGLLSALAEACAWDRLLATAAEAIPVLEAYGDRPNLAVARHNQTLAFNALGEYQQARQALEQNVKVFVSIRSRRALGVTQLVMGEISEHEGNTEEAMVHYRKALENAEAVTSLDGIAAAQWSLGALFVKLEQPLDAIPLLESALASWIQQGNQWERNQTEAVLGLALLMGGERARAEEFAANGWDYFQAGKPMSEKPQQWLWSLYRLLVGLNQSERAQEIMNAAYAELQRQAKNISDPNQRRSFFERVPENRAIVQAYDRIEGGPRVTTVLLVRADVPLGRVVRHDELISVRWTVYAPDDDAILDKAERRLYRLNRLIDEAKKQGAAPTDDDLAQALGVSRRTILRDMQTLTKPPTRKRRS